MFEEGDKVKIIERIEALLGGPCCEWDVHGLMQYNMDEGIVGTVVTSYDDLTTSVQFPNGRWTFLNECLQDADEVDGNEYVVYGKAQRARILKEQRAVRINGKDIPFHALLVLAAKVREASQRMKTV